MTLNDIKNIKLPLKTVISIIILVVSSYAYIEDRYVHQKEYDDFKVQQSVLTNYFADQITRLDIKLDRESSHQ